jgi:hypothetical protein
MSEKDDLSSDVKVFLFSFTVKLKGRGCIFVESLSNEQRFNIIKKIQIMHSPANCDPANKVNSRNCASP